MNVSFKLFLAPFYSYCDLLVEFWGLRFCLFSRFDDQ